MKEEIENKTTTSKQTNIENSQWDQRHDEADAGIGSETVDRAMESRYETTTTEFCRSKWNLVK